MAADNSFDVVSKVELQEVKNAIDQASKEVHARFDLKDSKSKIELEGTDAIQPARTTTSSKPSSKSSRKSSSSAASPSKTSSTKRSNPPPTPPSAKKSSSS